MSNPTPKFEILYPALNEKIKVGVLCTWFEFEVATGKPLTQVQQQFPELCKVGPNTRMSEIVNNNLPGISLVHLPNPPRQIRVVSSNVYFLLEKKTALWQEFSTAPAIGMHFAGDWPELKLELWAIPERA